MNKQPKAIFFDLDETLVKNKIPVQDLFGRMYSDFKEELGEDKQHDFFAALRVQAGRLWNSMFESQNSPESQFVQCFANSISEIDSVAPERQNPLAQDMFNHYIHLSSNNVELHDGALHTLAGLSERGIITGLITNGIEQVQLGKIHTLQLQTKVDHVTVSAQARAHKPYQPVFDLALTRASMSPADSWQVGDHATNDVAGAIRAGMSGVYYNPKGHDIDRAFADLEERPSFTIHHLLDIFELIDS